MKTIIAGGRTYWLAEADFDVIDAIHAEQPITEVVCGMARGADAGGYWWSWWRLGKGPAEFPYVRAMGAAGGAVRNRHMARYADALILFPGGKGSADMLAQANKKKLVIYEVHSDGSDGLYVITYREPRLL